jgi:hypothetical protein
MAKTNLVQPAVECAVDSGAGQHCFSNKAVFDFYTDELRSLETANGSDLTSPGSGSVLVHTTSGIARFTDSLHTPNLSEQGLLSVSQFDKHGYTSIFSQGRFMLIPNSTCNELVANLQVASILNGVLSASSRLYTTNLKSTSSQGQAASAKVLMASLSKRSSRDWHLALNHISSARLKELTKSLVTGIQLKDHIDKDCSCAACFVGKSKQLPYLSSSDRVLNAIGDLISVDGFGRLSIPDWNVNQYFLRF